MAENASDTMKVEMVGADTAKDSESAQVLDALQKLLQALGRKDINAVGECLSPDVIVLDTRSHNVIFGKKDVLDHISKNVFGTGSKSPVKSIAVYNPYVDIKGDTAMVSFRAVKGLNDDRDSKLECWCSQVFERKDNQWKVLHFQSNWEPTSGK
ncbi:MAG: nuclear transport factor 2 family protein [Terriglobales bacterium]